MRITRIAAATALCILLLGTPALGGSALQEESAAAIAPFSKRLAMNQVRKLANDIGVRVRATKAEKKAAKFVRTKLTEYGYTINVQTFSVDSGTSRNVVGKWPGARRFGLVIGAHIDTVAGSPGANDNASGVAVMLQIARLFAGSEQVAFIKFVAFGSEEFGTDGRHHVGSQVFVNRLGKKGRNRLAGMISVDMIADGRPLIVGTAGIGPQVVARTVHRKMSKAGFSVSYRTTCDCSDNGPFERAGIPGAFLWSDFEPNYHEPSDTPPNLSKADLVRTGRALRKVVLDVDLDLIRRFRRH